MLTSIGLSVNTHVCQGDIKSIGIILPAHSCSEMANGICAERNHEDGFNRLPCCTNISLKAPQNEYEENSYVGQKSQSAPKTYVTNALVNYIPTENLKHSLIEIDPPDWNCTKVQAKLQVFII